MLRTRNKTGDDGDDGTEVALRYHSSSPVRRSTQRQLILQHCCGFAALCAIKTPNDNCGKDVDARNYIRIPKCKQKKNKSRTAPRRIKRTLALSQRMCMQVHRNASQFPQEK